ncbi:Heavy metal transport/detoxification protein [Melia azedarach]|uniref:Heavy metal transport/detoxification protein n=1 Tax=Melia azedarach TaxID=155640 RepID=A0ACC1WTH0_MELAZ|nr:Heavy metal transport/detoxification protein [Melia azedarach]
MKQKIVMKVQMNCQKCRTQALMLAASACGPEKDKVVVIGDGVDSVKLVTCLRKKVGCTELLTVAETK